MRKRIAPELKTEIALKALRKEKPLAQLAAEHNVSVDDIKDWKARVEKGLPALFVSGSKASAIKQAEIKEVKELLTKELNLGTTLAAIIIGAILSSALSFAVSYFHVIGSNQNEAFRIYLLVDLCLLVGCVVALIMFVSVHAMTNNLVAHLSEKTTESRSVLDRIVSRHLSIKYYPAFDENDPDAAKKMYQQCTAFIKQTQHSIQAVNSYVEMCHVSDDQSCKEERTAYYQAIVEQANRQEVEYRRYLQLNCSEKDLHNPEKVQALISDLGTDYRDHLTEIIEAKKHIGAGGAEVSLEWAVARYPTSFVLIDKKHLIWQLNEHSPTERASNQADNLAIRGVLLISDAQEEITRHFNDWHILIGAGDNEDVRPEHLKPTPERLEPTNVQS